MDTQIDQTDPLKPLIANADEFDQPQPGREKRIIIDVNRRQAVPSTWFRAASNFKYFIVALSSLKITVHGQTQVIYLSDLENGRALGLKVDYEATCAPEQEARLAEALFDGSSPSVVFHGLIKSWVHESITQEPGSFINDFFSRREAIARHVSNRALVETGLRLKAELSICGKKEVLPSITVGPADLTVTLKDHSFPHHVKLTAELLLDEQNEINAWVYHPHSEKLDELMKDAVSLYLARHITVQDFYSQTGAGALQANLKNHLDETLKPFGRRVELLKLEQERTPPMEFYDAERDITYKAFNDPKPIVITSTSKMFCQDYVRYFESGSPDLNSWLAQTIDSTVSQVLFRRKYLEILLEFDAIAAEIVDHLKASATAIGCELQQAIKLVKSEPSTWLQPFTVETEASFETSVKGFHAKLAIGVVAKLRQLNRVSEELRSGQSIPKVIENRIIEEVGQILRRVHPELLYLQFRLAEQNKPALEEVLREKIGVLLDREFDADVLTVRFETVDTEFTLWLAKIVGERLKFEVEINSLRPSEPEPITIQGTCQIEAIHREGWHRVQQMQVDLNEIRQEVIGHLQSNLETRSVVALTYLDEEGAGKVKAEIKSLIRNYLLEEFGLLVKVENLRRKLTPVEEDLKRKYTDLEKKKRDAEMFTQLLRVEEIRKLQQHLIQIIANDGTESEVAQVKRSIEIMREYGGTEDFFHHWENLPTQQTEAEQETGQSPLNKQIPEPH